MSESPLTITSALTLKKENRSSLLFHDSYPTARGNHLDVMYLAAIQKIMSLNSKYQKCTHTSDSKTFSVTYA